MIVLHSSNQEAKLRIVSFLQSQTQEPIAIAQTDDEIIDLARQHQPKNIFIFAPLKVARAVEIQTYLRELIPSVRVRILPCVHGTEQLLDCWQEVGAKALRPRQSSGRNPKAAQS